MNARSHGSLASLQRVVEKPLVASISGRLGVDANDHLPVTRRVTIEASMIIKLVVMKVM